MTDLTPTITAKSDQLNADDLVGGPKRIHITSVVAMQGEQPIGIHYEGDEGRVYKPCKSMRRVLVHCWGADGNKYVGRQLVLYRDADVMYAGVKVGGIRISHMTHIDADQVIALQANKKQKKPYTVKKIDFKEPPGSKKKETPPPADEPLDVTGEELEI